MRTVALRVRGNVAFYSGHATMPGFMNGRDDQRQAAAGCGTMIDEDTERPLRIAHLTTVDMSLALLLETELRACRERGGARDACHLGTRTVSTARSTETGARFIAVPELTRSWSLGADLRERPSCTGFSVRSDPMSFTPTLQRPE